MNEQEREEFKKELDGLGLQIITNDQVEGDYGLGIEFDLDTSVDYSHLIDEDFVMKKLTGRKDFFYVVLKSYDTEKKRLTIMVATPVSKALHDYYFRAASSEKKIGTNFPDLCWYHAEGTTKLTEHEVETTFREDATMGDLTWYLPTRMVDNYIEIMHTLNHSFLQGVMQDTICYGPYLMSMKS